MGRRRAEATTPRYAGLQAVAEGLLLPSLGFVLEVAMLASFVYWGFRQAAPWSLVFGLGMPAVVVVLWGMYLAPKSARRLPPDVVSRTSLLLFLLAGAALLAAGAAGLGTIMAVAALAWFAASRWSGRAL